MVVGGITSALTAKTASLLGLSFFEFKNLYPYLICNLRAGYAQGHYIL